MQARLEAHRIPGPVGQISTAAEPWPYNLYRTPGSGTHFSEPTMFSANAAPLQGFARWRNTALLPLDLRRNAPRAKRAGTPCSRRRRRAAMPPGWRVRHAHGASSEGRRADMRTVCTVPRHGARRGAPVRRAAQPRGRRAGARPVAAGRRWAPAFASRCQAPGPSPGCRCGCVRIKVGAARCCARP